MMAGVLEQRFADALGAFNAVTINGTYEGLRPFFDPGVVMSKVNDPHSPPITGIDNVIKYLNAGQTQKLPKLEAPNPHQTSNPLAGATIGEVTGNGTYVDDSVHKPSGRVPVTYRFTFRKDANNTWLITEAFARP
jgi:hypothetical protein